MRRVALAVVSGVWLSGCAYGVPNDVSVPVEARDAGGVERDARAPAAPDSGVDATVAWVDAGSGDAAPLDAGAVDSGADASDAGGGSTWASPTCDGVIAAAEYGGAQHALSNGNGQTWHVAWDATNLYVAVEGANTAEGAVVYVGHGLLGGSTTGQAYDGTQPTTLSFSANAVTYVKASYNEVRVPTKSVWNKTGSITVCTSGATREVILPWLTLGANGLPSSFRFAAYVTSAGGWVYGQVPTNNPSGQVGLNASFPHDYWVQSTANGAGTFPFATLE